MPTYEFGCQGCGHLSSVITRSVGASFEEYEVELPEETREMIDAAREGAFPGPLKEL